MLPKLLRQLSIASETALQPGTVSVPWQCTLDRPDMVRSPQASVFTRPQASFTAVLQRRALWREHSPLSFFPRRRRAQVTTVVNQLSMQSSASSQGVSCMGTLADELSVSWGSLSAQLILWQNKPVGSLQGAG